MSNPVGKVYVEIEAKLEALRAQLKQAKAESARAGTEIGTAVKDQIGAGIEATKKPATGLNSVFSELLGIVTGVAGKIAGMSALTGTLIGLTVNYRSIWASINEYVSNLLDSTKKSTEALGTFASEAQKIIGALGDEEINIQIAAETLPEQVYELQNRLEDRLNARRLAAIQDFADKQAKALKLAGVAESEAAQRITAFREQAEKALDDRAKTRKFALGRQLLEAQERAEEQLERKREAAAAKEKRDADERLAREQKIIDMQERAARQLEESIKRATQPMIDALESFRNFNQGGRLGQSDAFQAQLLSGIQRTLNDIKRQQVRI